MAWRYQLTKQTVHGEVEYAIREFYFDTSENISGWTSSPITLTADSKEEMLITLDRIKNDIERGGVLDIDAEERKTDAH